VSAVPDLPDRPDRPDLPDRPEHPEHPQDGRPAGPEGREPEGSAGTAGSDDADGSAGPAADAEAAGADRPATDDELFAQLVAGFDDPVEAGARTWPEAEDVSDLAPAPRPRPSIMRLPVVQALPPVDPRSWTPAEGEDDDHFVPPPPPPLPSTEVPTRLALAALVGGLVLIGLYLAGQLPGLGGLLGGCMFLGGTAALVARMKSDDDDDDPDPHHGAVV
jgi:hypothetical protein